MKGETIFKNEKFHLTSLDGMLFLIPKGLTLSHCSVCGKRRKILRHHIIPKRCQCKIDVINEFMLNICNECEKKVHPEYKEVWKDLKEKGKMQSRIGEQRKQITGLINKLKKKGLA
jgi:hypothetical protein